MKKVIVQIKGGIGNQLFCYAFARSLAFKNNAELIIDNITGFEKDFVYNRIYMLNHFNISFRKIKKYELFWPLNTYFLWFLKFVSNNIKFTNIFYIKEENLDYNEEFTNINFKKFIYLDGYWQSESYFKDIENIIRKDLKIHPPQDLMNQNISNEINKLNSVAIHVRWFDSCYTTPTHNITLDYYTKAISKMNKLLKNPHFFVFSDDPIAAKVKLDLYDEKFSFVSHNKGDSNSYADLWLMTQCKHFIIANSTFSWWGAWLSESKNKIVITPEITLNGKTSWGFKGLIPNEWEKL